MQSQICKAPATNLFFRPDGEVRACCRNDRVLGHIGSESLVEIWQGNRRAELVTAIGDGDMTLGCVPCGEEIEAEGPAGAYPRAFDRFGNTPSSRWPERMEFNLSNACNLQCVQCDGDLSSSIRAHREHRPPLVSPYDDGFFAELREFISHLRWVSFAGGEPFLSESNYRVWGMIRELKPSLEGTIVTNATTWGRKQAEALADLRLGFTLSIDAIDRDLAESIRAGTRQETTMANADAMILDASRRGVPAAVNFCLMRSNALEMPVVIEWAEQRGIAVNVSVVRSPRDLSLVDAPRPELESIAAALRRRAAAVRDGLVANASTLDAEVARIDSWTHEDASPVRLRGVGRFKVLGFSCEPTPAHDQHRKRDDPRPGGGAVAGRIVVNRDDIVESVEGDLDGILGVESASLLARPVADFARLVHERRVHVERHDWHEMTVRLPGGSAHVVLRPDRDDTGWAETASIWITPIDGQDSTIL